MTLVVIFYFDIWDLDTGTGVRPAEKRRNNAGLPSGKFCKGVKRSETIPCAATKDLNRVNLGFFLNLFCVLFLTLEVRCLVSSVTASFFFF